MSEKEPVATMLGARSVAVVGASPTPGSFGERVVTELTRSPGVERLHLVNPKYPRIGERPTTRLDDVPPVDLVLLAVGDRHLPDQLAAAATAGARSAVIYGSAHGSGLRSELRDIATDAGMALCGAGCMGFVNATTGLRAIGYLERDPLPSGPAALITHSGSVFSALLRTRRAFGFSLAVSSGQELVTTTADYVAHVLDAGSARVIALVLETVRDASRLRAVLHRARAEGVPVVSLSVVASSLNSSMVAAHSGALAGAGAAWEALAEDTGALRVHDLAELTDALELLCLAPPPGSLPAGAGMATVHDSGAERALAADVAERRGVPFAALSPPTLARLGDLLDDGLAATNPLDVWGTGADTRGLFAACLTAMDDDPAVALTALAVDLVPEYDGDTSYPDAVLDAAAVAAKPVAVLANLPSAIDEPTAARLRAGGVPVLEGTTSGFVAVRHWLTVAGRGPVPAPEPAVVDAERAARWRARLLDPAPWRGAESFALLADYDVPAVAVRAVDSEGEAAKAAAEHGYPVVLKTDAPGVAHKSDGGGVVLGLTGEAAVRAAYRDVAGRFGPEVLVGVRAASGVEVSVGLTADPLLGPVVVLAAGGTLVELLDDRVVACPPLTPARAHELLDRLRIAPLLNGFRGSAPVHRDALVRAVLGVSAIAVELGDLLAGLDVNPVIASPAAAVAVDVLVIPELISGGGDARPE